MRTYNTKVTIATIMNDINKSDSAIREAIANSIDANSKNIYLNFYIEKTKNGMEIEYFCLDIADDGDGIPIEEKEFEEVFCQYKVSLKKGKSNYGKKGKGRYTYLTLVNDSKNISIFTKDNNKKVFKINFKYEKNENITIAKNEYNKNIETDIPLDKVTTLIQFKNLKEDKFNIYTKKKEDFIDYIRDEIISFFADRIASKSINIYLNNKLLDIDDYLERKVISKVFKEENFSFKVDFYIWNKDIKLKSDRQKHILFFDKNRRLKGIAPSGKHKLAFNGFTQNHSILVESEYFNDKDFTEHNDYDNLFTDLIIKKLKNRIAIELEHILYKIYQANINKISDEYLSFLNITKDEMTENVYHTLLLPFVAKFGNKKIGKDIKSIIVKLINTLASESPDTFIKNLETILDLTKEESKQIQYIQENYGLIATITEKEKIITKIDFLNNFDILVNGKDRKKIKERTQLHKVIEKNLWLIDEKFENIKFSDIMSDQSLKTILENEDFYQFDSKELEKISRKYDIKKIPDIFIPIKKENIIYIIELKKPNVKINRQILDEIEDKYIKTINSINRMKSEYQNKKIIAFAISDSKTENARTRGNINSDNVYIEPKSWIELIEKARERYNKKIFELDNRLKNSKWKNLDEFMLSYDAKIDNKSSIPKIDIDKDEFILIDDVIYIDNNKSFIPEIDIDEDEIPF